MTRCNAAAGIFCVKGIGARVLSTRVVPAQGTIGSITHTGTGDYAFSYLISAFDGNACPGTLPATAVRGTTAYLVTKDSLSCTNDDVAANPSNVIGAVTVFLIQSGPAKGKAKVVARINGAATNTTYHFFQKCIRSLSDITTDGSGDGAGIFNLPAVSGAFLAFEMFPEGSPAGNKYQSVRMSF